MSLLQCIAISCDREPSSPEKITLHTLNDLNECIVKILIIGVINIIKKCHVLLCYL